RLHALVELRQDAVHKRVAAADDLEIEIPPRAGGTLPRFETPAAEGVWNALELVVLLDARQRPERERLLAGGTARPFLGQRRADAVEIREQVFGVPNRGNRAGRLTERPGDGISQRGEADAAPAVRGHARDTERARKRLEIRRALAHLVDHVHGHDHGDPELEQLDDEVEIACDLSGVDDDDAQARARIAGSPEDRLERYLFFGGARGERVRPGHVHELRSEEHTSELQ